MKDELEAARRESAIAEAEVFDLRQEIDRVQTEALELKFSLKKNSLEYERERATYQHENHELEKLIRELGGKMETLEAQVIVAKRQQVASEAEAREILQRAEAAEEVRRALSWRSLSSLLRFLTETSPSRLHRKKRKEWAFPENPVRASEEGKSGKSEERIRRADGAHEHGTQGPNCQVRGAPQGISSPQSHFCFAFPDLSIDPFHLLKLLASSSIPQHQPIGNIAKGDDREKIRVRGESEGRQGCTRALTA